MNNTGVRPIGDRVLVRRVGPETVSKGGIHKPQGSESWPTLGKVLAVGNKVKCMEIVPGARVVFKPRPSSALVPDTREDFKPEWERVIMLREEDILCVVGEM